LGLSEIEKLMEVLVGLRGGEARTEADYLCARSADIYTLTRGSGVGDYLLHGAILLGQDSAGFFLKAFRHEDTFRTLAERKFFPHVKAGLFLNLRPGQSRVRSPIWTGLPPGGERLLSHLPLHKRPDKPPPPLPL